MAALPDFGAVPGADREGDKPHNGLDVCLSRLPGRHTEAFWFNRGMASLIDTATGRSDLEPFWPSRQAHHFDRECCRAMSARVRAHG